MPRISMDKKYRTRDGRDVRLLCVDGPEDYPVIGVVDGEHLPAAWSAYGEAVKGIHNDTDLIEYREPDIRTIWVNVYDGYTSSHDRERDAKSASCPGAIAIAQPVTFEVKRNT